MPTVTEYPRAQAAFTGLTASNINASTLGKEIRADAGITIALDHIDVNSAGASIWFKDALPVNDEAALDVVVAAHTGEAGAEAAVLVALEPDPIAKMPVVQPLAIRPSAQDKQRNWQATAPPKTIANADIRIDNKLTGANGLCLLAGGKYICRTNAAHGSALHLAVVDRDNLTGLFPLLGMQRTRVDLSGISGTINVGDFLVGDESGARSEVLAAVDADTFEITFCSGWDDEGYPIAWKETEAITVQDAAGAPTGATATLDDWVEGGIIEIQRPVENEWVEGFESDEIKPGGSAELPLGYYLRIICYNNHERDHLRMTVGLTLGLE